MKKLYAIILIIIGLGIAWYWYDAQKAIAPAGTGAASSAITPVDGFDGRNSTFSINGKAVTLKNGFAQSEAAPGSASKITTTYFGNEAVGDLNFDGKPDAAFLVTQTTGGTGTFFYVVAVLRTDTGYRTTNAFFIGDRIAPQTTEIQSQTGELRVNFAQRKLGEPMTSQASQGATLFLKVTPDGVLEGLMK